MTKQSLNPESTTTDTDPSDSTIQFYEIHARKYFDRTVAADLSAFYDRFLPYVTPGGRILDAGCGSGRDLRVFRNRGFEAVGIDASQALAKLATAYSGAPCLAMRIEQFAFGCRFDAVWACASLLHLPKHRLPAVLQLIHNALVAHGWIFASVQLGEGEGLLPDGRYFSYYTREEFEQLLTSAGFSIGECWVSEDSLPSRRPIRWINVIARRGTIGRGQEH